MQLISLSPAASWAVILTGLVIIGLFTHWCAEREEDDLP